MTQKQRTQSALIWKLRMITGAIGTCSAHTGYPGEYFSATVQNVLKEVNAVLKRAEDVIRYEIAINKAKNTIINKGNKP